MASKFPEEPDLTIVSDWLRSCGLGTSRFSTLETNLGKSPDFRVWKGKNLVGFCEVKSPNDTWLEDQFSSSNFAIVGGARNDPIFNRLARLVNKSVQQFEAVNAGKALFNILAFVNHDRQSRLADLTEVLTGHFHADTGERIPTMLKLSERTIGDSKWIPDVYVWFNAFKRTAPQMLFTHRDRDRRDQACALFGVDHRTVKTTAYALK